MESDLIEQRDVGGPTESSDRGIGDAVAKILRKLDGPREHGDYWQALCPAHDDENPSLSVREGDGGRALVHCHAGCRTEDVVAAIGLGMADLGPRTAVAGARNGNPSGAPASVQPGDGCTVATYAAGKGLAEDFVRSLGVDDVRFGGRPALKIPYHDHNGAEVAVRYRISMEGDRFRWAKGSKPTLYGRDRLRDGEPVVLGEGESDCHTLWSFGIAAVGLPGAANWDENRDAEVLSRVSTIFVVIEPDQGGATVAGWIAKSSIRDRVRVLDLGGFKDPSVMYLDDPAAFRQRFQEAMAAAVPWGQWEEVLAARRREAALACCRDLATSKDILGEFAADLAALGVVGEVRTAKILFLALVSRMLDKIVSAVVKGPSSAGKSYVIENVLKFFPAASVIKRTAGSERSLAYGTEPLSHRFLVYYEAAGLGSDFAQYLIRSLLSEGRLSYETVEKNINGELKVRKIEREGPTGLILTTTAFNLHPENETRMFSLTISDSPAQTKAVMRSLAAQGPSAPAVDLARWLALQVYLEVADHQVEVPFADALVDFIPPVAVRLRRDFSAVLGLVRAHAVLCQLQRERGARGIIATVDDYAVVHDLVAEVVAQGLGSSVPQSIRETVEAVGWSMGTYWPKTFKYVADNLGLDESSAWRRVKAAIRAGYVRNEETRRGQPAKLVLGEPMPDDMEILPSPSRLQGCTLPGGVASPTATLPGGSGSPAAITALVLTHAPGERDGVEGDRLGTAGPDPEHEDDGQPRVPKATTGKTTIRQLRERLQEKQRAAAAVAAAGPEQGGTTDEIGKVPQP